MDEWLSLPTSSSGAHPASLARFWVTVLDGYEIAPYDDAALARLRAAGIDDPENDPSVLVQSSDPLALRLFFTAHSDLPPGGGRIHVDLRVSGLAAEVTRLTVAGARVVTRHSTHVVFLDPEDNEFCVFPT